MINSNSFNGQSLNYRRHDPALNSCLTHWRLRAAHFASHLTDLWRYLRMHVCVRAQKDMIHCIGHIWKRVVEFINETLSKCIHLLCGIAYTQYGFIRNAVKSLLVPFLIFLSISTIYSILILQKISTIVSFFEKWRRNKRRLKSLDFLNHRRLFFN